MSLPDYSTQLPGARQAVAVGFDDLLWGYGEDPAFEPHRFFGNRRGYKVKADPRPCYSHDLALVADTLERLHEFAPLCAPVSVNVSSLQDARGSNGWAQQQWEYYGDGEDAQVWEVNPDGSKTKKRARNFDGVIVLSGRTTEIHPAIARYVVPHEYAHILEDALGLIRHDGAGEPGGQLLREWAKVRRLPAEAFELRYGTTTHHLMPGEVFANDFRFMFGAETEWWPHRELVPALGERGTKRAVSWWQDALDQLRDCYTAAAAAL